LVSGQRVYGEQIIRKNGSDFRSWNPFRSKLAAGLHSGLENLAIEEGNIVLYLGSAEGTTVSHVSDLVGKNGLVIGVDISAKATARFTILAETRENVLPLLADANNPRSFAEKLNNIKVDVIIQDISQKNQAGIFSKNWSVFSKPATTGFLVIKTRSVDMVQSPEAILKQQLAVLKSQIYIQQIIRLEKYEKNHFLIHVKGK
jgi:fibrillarin-like pre-rRNA processing protein